MLVADFKNQENFLVVISNNSIVSVAAVAFGALTMLVSSIGICGAIAASQVTVKIYTYVLGLLTIVQIAIVAFSGVNKNYLVIAEGIWHGADQSAKDYLQNEFRCCGLHSPSEYDDNGGVPKTCLSGGSSGNGYEIWESSCSKKLADWAESNWVPLVGTGSAIIGLQLLMFAVSFIVCCCKPKNRHKVKLSRGVGSRGHSGISQSRNDGGQDYGGQDYSGQGQVNQNHDAASQVHGHCNGNKTKSRKEKTQKEENHSKSRQGKMKRNRIDRDLASLDDGSQSFNAGFVDDE